LADDIRLSEIDESNRGDHTRLTAQDKCYYIYEYTSGRDYRFSATNDRINNLKKKPTASAAQLNYKRGAIRLCAQDLSTVLNAKWLDQAALVPTPCSKASDHPDYDTRMEQVARTIRPGLDVRNLVIQQGTTIAAHEAADGPRVSVDDLLALYAIDETLAAPTPKTIGILDDVLTAGTHFRAMSTILAHRFPGVPIAGLFIARRVFPSAAEAFD
jgi:hypothetical protein